MSSILTSACSFVFLRTLKAPRGKPKTKQTTVKDQEKTRSSPVKRWKVPTTFIEGGKELDMICENNVHGNPQKWTVYDSGFFVPSYQKTKKAGFVVSHCLKCCRKFIAGKGVKVSDPETEFLVTRDTEGTVWACPGAVKRSKGCNCVRALCAPCYTRVKDVCE